MTSTQWLTGSLVVLGATVGAAVTSPWSARTFVPPPPSSTTTDAASAPHTRTCITLSGKRFEWNFPNAPFGTLSCSE
jgi:hypothetical protein